VELGESLLVLEAMKMENEIKSLSKGVIKTNNCKIGESVDKGELLFIIE
ncbi:MAG TPA: acetyl-CoA carboxylase biotin carboxyl carrier protein subunit, partial [Bacteroidetes bacterium]|nr:acetyl-CoA carboxylase biotin carboxyl carrier protein subunit [Bacteroidota bacterium]